MTARRVESESPDEVFVREVRLRAELIVARLRRDYWAGRVRELEAQLPEGSPLRSGEAGGA